MKILQLGKFYPVLGGVEKVMWNITAGLNASGIDADMMCAKFGRDQVSAADAAQLGDHLICCKAWAKLAGTMIAPSMIFRLRRTCIRYDVIHVHHPDPMAALALLLSGYKGKVVLHWHSDIVSQRFFFWFYRPLQTWLLRRAAAIVGTSPAYLESSHDLDPFRSKTQCVPIGIMPVLPEKELVCKVRSKYAGKKLLLAVGRLVPYKGYPCMIEALAALPKDYHLAIVGQGPLRKSLAKLARDFGVLGRISFLGYVGDEMVHAYMGACDAFLLTSSMKTEAFGIVQLEAFSCGKPVVSTRIPGSGVAWVNENDVSGYTVPVGDAMAVANAVRAICNTPGAAGRLGAGARERFDAMFTHDRMIAKTICIYEKITEN